MTSPSLAFGVAKRGRHYPWPAVDPSGWPRNRWGQVEPDDIPEGVEIFPSVTNVLSVFSDGGDGLLYWSAEEALRSLYGSGVIPTDVDEAVESHRAAFRARREERADEGTRAHTLAQALADDVPLPSSISEVDEQYADAFMAFWSEYEPTPLATEITLYGDGYAGTADLICEIGGSVVVVDYKTKGKKGKGSSVYDKTMLQISALASAEHDAEGRVWSVDDGLAVVLFPDGTFEARMIGGERIRDRWFPGFQGCLLTWQAVKGV